MRYFDPLRQLYFAAGFITGVVGMGSLRASAEHQSQALERSRRAEREKLLAECERRQVLATEQQRLDQQNAPEKAQSLQRSIEKDFNEGLERPVAVGTTLTLKKRAFSALFSQN